MQLVKNGQICNVCQPNALMTLQEYLDDYGREDTKIAGERLIEKEIDNIKNEKIKAMTVEYLEKIRSGQRDFRI